MEFMVLLGIIAVIFLLGGVLTLLDIFSGRSDDAAPPGWDEE